MKSALLLRLEAAESSQHSHTLTFVRFILIIHELHLRQTLQDLWLKFCTHFSFPYLILTDFIALKYSLKNTDYDAWTWNYVHVFFLNILRLLCLRHRGQVSQPRATTVFDTKFYHITARPRLTSDPVNEFFG
jgi:hypothetical protein